MAVAHYEPQDCPQCKRPQFAETRGEGAVTLLVRMIILAVLSSISLIFAVPWMILWLLLVGRPRRWTCCTCQYEYPVRYPGPVVVLGLLGSIVAFFAIALVGIYLIEEAGW